MFYHIAAVKFYAGNNLPLSSQCTVNSDATECLFKEHWNIFYSLEKVCKLQNEQILNLFFLFYFEISL